MSDQSSGLAAEIDAAPVDHVILEFGDINGISRSHQVSVRHFHEQWESGFTIPTSIISCTPQTVPAEGSRYGAAKNYADGRLHPDPETFKVVPWLEQTGRVLCDLTHDGDPVVEQPRVLLRRVLADAAERFSDLSFSVGSELEFYLFDVAEDGEYVPATDHEHEDLSWQTEAVHGFHRDVVANADTYGVPLDLLQHEHGPGQLEILFDYGDPAAQADLAFDFKRLVKQTARKRGQRATFMAKPIAEKSGSGYHLHVSCRDDAGENAFAAEGGDGLSETGRQFVGGLIDHADALVALQTATLNGYKRFTPGAFAPSTASWGYDNRMAGVRIPEDSPRVELRYAGADANPYIVVASTLAAGLDGIERELDPGDPVSDRDPAGECPDLPRTPELALRALESDDALVEALGERFVSEFVAVKRQDLAEFRGTVTDWERDCYVDML
jgi:glutamine synthetase